MKDAWHQQQQQQQNNNNNNKIHIVLTVQRKQRVVEYTVASSWLEHNTLHVT